MGYEPIEGGDELPRFDPFASAPGGGPGFFRPGPVAANATGHKMKCTGGHDLEVKDRQSTEERYRRLLNVQQDYESIAVHDPNVSFRRIWKFVPGATSFRPSHQSADGQTVDLNQPFNVGGESLDLPADTINGSPGNVFDCRCRVEYQRVELNPVTGQFQPVPISNGGKAKLTDDEIAIIILNENKGLSVGDWDEAGRYIAHAVINGDEKYGKSRPRTAKEYIMGQLTQKQVPLLQQAKRIVAKVRSERAAGLDLTSGRLFYNHRRASDYTNYDIMMETLRKLSKARIPPYESIGPFVNGKGGAVGPGNDIYLVLYDRKIL